FLPEGTERSFELLTAKNGADGYLRVQVPNYNHMDCFVGKNAAQDIYPLILGQLDVYNPVPAAASPAALPAEATALTEEAAWLIHRPRRKLRAAPASMRFFNIP